MAVPPGKTPISYLQEYCTKRGLTPQYDLIANEGAVHEPTFLMRVTVGDVVATGKGSSKKKAKHCAAQSALNQLIGVQNGQNSEENGVDAGNGDEGVGNPIGELQEFTQKKLMKPPIYEFSNEQGPPHAREFVCTIKLGKYIEKGTGRSKKAAKRTAAAQMLQHIKSLSPTGEKPQQVEESDEDEEISLGFETKGSYTALKERGKPQVSATPQYSKDLQVFYEKIMKASGKQLKSVGAPAPSSNFCQMLQEIAEVQRFEVSCFDISECTTTGMYQCLIQLTTSPVAVCHGSGVTKDDSHANAAFSALQYLRIMTKS